jgi:hypothetical protein
MSWLSRFSEYADLPGRQQWELLQAAKRQLRSHPREWLVLAGQWSVSILLGVAVTLAPRLLSPPSMLVTALFWVLGLLGSVFLGQYFYDRKLRQMIRGLGAQRLRSGHEHLQGDGE